MRYTITDSGITFHVEPEPEPIPLAEALETVKRVSAQIETLDCECRRQGASVRCGTCGVEDCIMNRA